MLYIEKYVYVCIMCIYVVCISMYICMYVCLHKQLIYFQNCLAVLSRLCYGQDGKTFSHFKSLRGRHDAVSLAICCLRATG